MAEYRSSFTLDNNVAAVEQAVNRLNAALSDSDKATKKNLQSFRTWQNDLMSKADSLAQTLRVKVGESYKYADAAAQQHQKILRQEVAASYRAADIAAQRYHQTLREKVAASYRHADAAAQQHNKRLREETAASYRAADAQCQRWNKSLRSSVNDMNAMDAAFERVNARIKQFASFIIAAMIIRGFSTAVRGTASVIIEFDQALYSLQAITRANTHEARLMGDTILDVARKTKFSAGEVAAGMELIGRAGFSASESIHSIDAVANLATGTLESFEDVVDLMTTTMRAFHMESVQATEISDVFANAINNSKLTIDKLSTAFNYVGAASYQAGLTLNETTGSLMLLANAGVRASTMGTGLRRMFLQLIAPNQRLRDALYEVGMSVDDLNPRLVGWEQTLNNLTGLMYDAEAGAVDMGLAASFFGVRAAQAVAVLVDATAKGGALAASIEMTREIGAAARMAALQQEGLGNQFKNLQDRTKLVAIAMGDAGLNGVLSAVINNLRDLMEGLENLFRHNKAFTEFVAIGASVATITAAFAALAAAIKYVKPLLLGIAVAAKSPFVLITAGIVSAITAIRYFMDRTEDLALAHEKLAIEIAGSTDTINAWARALDAALDAGDRQYLDTIRRYIEQNKELSDQTLKIINEHELLGSTVYHTWEQMMAETKNLEQFNKIVKKAFDIQNVEKFKESIAKTSGQVEFHTDKLNRLNENLARVQEVYANRIDAGSKQAIEELNRVTANIEKGIAETEKELQTHINTISNYLASIVSITDISIEEAMDLLSNFRWPEHVLGAIENELKATLDNTTTAIENFQADLKDRFTSLPDDLKDQFEDLSIFDQKDFAKELDNIDKYIDKVREWALANEHLIGSIDEAALEKILDDERKKRAAEAMEKLSGSTNDGTKSISDFQKALDSSIQSYEQQIILFGKGEKETAKWTEAFKLGLESVEDLPPALDELIDRFFDLKEAADIENVIADHAKIVNDLVEEYRRKTEMLTMTAMEQDIYNAILRMGTEATTEQIQAVTDEIKAYHDLKNELNETADEHETMMQKMVNATKGWASNFSSQLNDVLWDANRTFGDILESFAKMITQMVIHAKIVEPLLGIAGGFSLFSAHGHAFDGGHVQPFAKGGIVDQPTVFPFAKGIGLMGEAGPEAIMPLTRTSSGDLGVKAEVGGGKQDVRIHIHNESGQKMQVTDSRANFDAQGMIIDLWLDGFQRNKHGLRTVLGG